MTGYGTNLKNATFSATGIWRLFRMEGLPSEIGKEYRKFVEKFGGFDSTETADIFARNFVDPDTNDCGESALIAYVLKRVTGNENFSGEYGCLYYPADVPVDAAARDKMLTQEDLKRLMEEYLNLIYWNYDAPGMITIPDYD